MILCCSYFLPASAKSVYVHGYYRKNGTYVQSHFRSSPGSGSSAKSAPSYSSPGFQTSSYGPSSGSYTHPSSFPPTGNLYNGYPPSNPYQAPSQYQNQNSLPPLNQIYYGEKKDSSLSASSNDDSSASSTDDAISVPNSLLGTSSSSLASTDSSGTTDTATKPVSSASAKRCLLGSFAKGYQDGYDKAHDFIISASSNSTIATLPTNDEFDQLAYISKRKFKQFLEAAIEQKRTSSQSSKGFFQSLRNANANQNSQNKIDNKPLAEWLVKNNVELFEQCLFEKAFSRGFAKGFTASVQHDSTDSSNTGLNTKSSNSQMQSKILGATYSIGKFGDSIAASANDADIVIQLLALTK
jgi:hypothetical protein